MYCDEQEADIFVRDNLHYRGNVGGRIDQLCRRDGTSMFPGIRDVSQGKDRFVDVIVVVVPYLSRLGYGK